MDNHLLLQQEQLRSEMVETALLEKSLLHNNVLEISQTLDVIIVQVQSERRLSRIS